MSARPASAVEELDDLNKSLVAQSGTILKTKSISVLIKIGVEVWLVAYRLYGYRMKSCYLWKITRSYGPETSAIKHCPHKLGQYYR